MSVATLAASSCIESKLPQEFVQAPPQLNSSRLGLNGFLVQPEQKQPGKRAVGIADRCIRFAVPSGLNGQCKIPVAAQPPGNVPRVGMGQGALHKLASHKGQLNRIRVLIDVFGGIHKLLLQARRRGTLLHEALHHGSIAGLD